MRHLMTSKPKTSQPRVWFSLSLLFLLWLIGLTGAVAAPPRQGEDLAVINSPSSNDVVRGVVQIIGSSAHPAFQFYVIEFAPEPVTGDQWQTIGATHQTSVISGVLENWDTTQIPDGSYTIRLRTVRQDGNYTEGFVQQVVVANTQVIPTATPTPTPADAQSAPAVPVDTPTPLPPTPTIIIEQPVVETPTPRPVPTSPPLEDPEEQKSFVPTVTGFSFSPLRDACLFGVGAMFSLFLLFGFLAALSAFIRGLMRRTRRKNK